VNIKEEISGMNIKEEISGRDISYINQDIGDIW